MNASALCLFRLVWGSGAGEGIYNLQGGVLNLTNGIGSMFTGNSPSGGTTAYTNQAFFNFTGGTLKANLLDASLPSITQSATSGASLLDVAGNNTIIGVNYTAASASNTATISVGTGYSLTMSNNATLAVGNGGLLSIAGGTLTGAAGTSLSLSTAGEGLQIGNGGVVSIPTIYLAGSTSANAIRYNGASTGGTISSNVVLQNASKTFNVQRRLGRVRPACRRQHQRQRIWTDQDRPGNPAP